MQRMRKRVLAKLKSHFSSSEEESRNELGNSLRNKLNVNEEYKEAFRTKSYVEMWSMIQGQLKRINLDGAEKERLASSSSSSPFYIHLSDYLFEPEQQQTLTDLIQSCKFHPHLIDYLDASLEACNRCDSLLRSIHQTRLNYRRIERVIKLSKRIKDSAEYPEKISGILFTELTGYSLLRNPLSFVSQLEFRDVHDKNMVLLHKLTSEQRKIRRKVKINKFLKKAGGICLLISHTAILIALLVIALHGFVGILAAPGIMSCLFYIFRRKIKFFNGAIKTSLLEKLCAQLDLAAKGTFILINDFDTMSRLVKSLYDEIEHKRELADMCVKSKNTELLKEVVKEFFIHDSTYQEQLDELEEHVYLCFHTINRSRRLVLQEIMVAKH